MSRHANCPGDDCPVCERAADDLDDAVDPDGYEADHAAERWVMGR